MYSDTKLENKENPTKIKENSRQENESIIKNQFKNLARKKKK